MKWVLLFAITLALPQCEDRKQLNTSEACQVIKNILYENCRFKFSNEELAALSQENKTKITAAKLFFRGCPQARKCAGSQ